ncbi:hypothetical protein [Streptomyces natalensis]|uniref:Uncharacterized protein n=1 Tax=Streptomyces natalensis ATCC 27448 TaxID=1240678 RepID=A0A0D7CRM0_9ACTN|nr:hypothetical protein [Streptomyces natalensis]KIZ18868.1 hypothetical protein SNA_06315 [Streptomyces natalensis ATCC 27448]
MRRALAALVGALALAGTLSLPAHADPPGVTQNVPALIGVPLKLSSDVGPLHLGNWPPIDLPH